MAAPKALICAMIILLGVVGFTCPRASAGRVPSVAPVPVRCASTGESNIVSAGTGEYYCHLVLGTSSYVTLAPAVISIYLLGIGGCGGSAPAAAEEKALLPVRLPPRLPPSRENLLKTPPRSIH